MSRINRIRIVNLNYNHNAIRIDDECFDLIGENTLMSLRNGGGKSVLIQMITAPFVHKRYRDAGDRLFFSYFTTNQPTFILVEWVLDHDAGFVLTGMMVRKNQDLKEEDEIKEELEIINFIHEYEYENDFDIKNIPLLIQEDGRKRLKGFHLCRQMFESCKQNQQLKFDYYDMNQSARSRAYFSKLEEYQIYAKEWETIIKKINLKESGLSELFKDAKDEKGLVEKWFLTAIEGKLNQQNDRMKNFEAMIKKYVLQYKANESNFKRRTGILEFREQFTELLSLEEELLTHEKDCESYELELAYLYAVLEYLDHEVKHASEVEKANLQLLANDEHALKYEQQSLHIYELQDQVTVKMLECQKQEAYLAKLGEVEEELEKRIHCYEAANRYRTYQQASEDVQRYESELLVAKKSEAELTPRLQDLGYSLSLAYERLLEREQEELERLRQEIEDETKKQQRLKQEVGSLNEDLQQLLGKQGQLQHGVKVFDEKEKQILKRYPLHVHRNLEGLYPTGWYEDLQQQLNGQLTTLKKEKKTLSEEKISLMEREHQLSRQSEGAHERRGNLQSRLKGVSEKLSKLEEEIQVRKNMSLFIAWTEDRIFETDEMIDAFMKKRESKEILLREYALKLDQLQKEMKKLESGEILSLPEELKQRLHEEGIAYMQGFEWLKRNQQSDAVNQELIKKNPFLPYSIILSEKEMARLKMVDLNTYTPYPVPILIREQLEIAPSFIYQNKYAQFESIHFYLWFNEELLDEERLKQLILLKQREIAELEEACTTQKTFMTRYDDHIGTLKHQTLSKEGYELTKQELADLIAEFEALEQEIILMHADKETVKTLLSKTTQRLNELEEQISLLQTKQEHVEGFARDYEAYIKVREQLKEVNDEIERIYDTLADLQDTLSAVFIQLDQTKDEERQKRQHVLEAQKKFDDFSSYTDGQELPHDVGYLVAEYEAIAEKLSGILKRSEADLKAAKERFMYEENELNKLMKRYGLVDADYQTLTYDQYAEEKVIEECRRHRTQVLKEQHVLSELKFAHVRLETDVKHAYEILKRELNEVEILPKQEVTNRNFEQLLHENQQQKQGCEKELTVLLKKEQLYARELSNLVEYKKEGLEVKEVDSNDWLLDEDDWRIKRATLLRDYKAKISFIETTRHRVSDEFNRLSHLALFEDDFFKKPLQRFILQKHAPAIFFEQYETMNQVFEKMILKLEVDLKMTEQEKDHVVELLLDYVKEVHRQLGLIDQNSSIPVRGKNVKMLRIVPPNWEEQEATYQTRMHDLVESLTNRCLELLSENHNIEEFIGHQVTTKQLFDQIVGLGNISIKLYKIEEQREYPITWEQVAKNSGGEGFLSAFVVLSSLLSFMRRDETDIFSSYEEGKVLLMDNPFAQTNAAHLLKPLIELAKKNNTQLICLSGLGGDSIYSRFENIYSLSLVPSSFKKGAEYLKSQHLKGEVEPHLVIPSRIHIEEEMIEGRLF